ncbi:MAG: hypothetical protein HKM93_23310 [Desulfobacteraceae bacterium]|nr:hypothetical protein [Desulfobacteraceae bacterium]
MKHADIIQWVLLLLISLWHPPGWESALAQSVDFSGQLSVWIQENHDDGRTTHLLGGRYIPRLSMNMDLTGERFIDAEVSVNAFWYADTRMDNDQYDADFHRAVVRYATPQTTTRIGLQKINFGPARILRSLRWFDRLDPTDPQQFTDGVWGGLFRYNALNNANAWLWILYGNEDLKGMDQLPTSEDRPEFGGRFQYPVPAGEIAVTAHTRQVGGDRPAPDEFTENRYALDGSWDVTVGTWFEAVLVQQTTPAIHDNYLHLATLGADYTFSIGNGLHLTLEHFVAAAGGHPLDTGETVHATAFSLDYPLNILDNVTALGFYNWDDNTHAQHVEWRRTYDRVTFSLSGFSYPQAPGDTAMFSSTSSVEGVGAQFMIIFNH